MLHLWFWETTFLMWPSSSPARKLSYTLPIIFLFLANTLELSHDKGQHLLQLLPRHTPINSPSLCSGHIWLFEKSTLWNGSEILLRMSRGVEVSSSIETECVQNCVCAGVCVFDLWSGGHISNVWIQLGCQEADKVSVVSYATGSDRLWASRAVSELCLLPETVVSTIYYPKSQVMPAVVKRILWLLTLVVDILF